MLPGYVSRQYTLSEIHLNLQKLCEFGNVNLILAYAVKIVMDEKTGNEERGGWVICSNGQRIKFDVLSINAGISPSLPISAVNEDNVKTEQETTAMANKIDLITPVKPISTFSSRYEALCDRLHETRELYNEENPFRLLVVGGGAGGIELALSAQYALQRILLGYIDEQGNEVKPNTNTKQTKDVAPLKVGVLMYNMRNQ
uniref:FAD/NAD(P)-binding domain-containing protein n=1 Tax=Ditylum brightwellii TaxID=49249 RepID=A0A6V2I4Y8_9STRA|mmetsp:Transcript_44979/g.67706  ORF Transcript_44979/g.67706 Transcript_44979/m.67706 type:complete len:200 (+) Transcript_44979:68-667(+)